MYQPISFNVIRQALEWHGFPVPKMRMLSYREDGATVIAEIYAEWQEFLIPIRFFGPANEFANADRIFLFKEELQQCFCEDVAIVEIGWVDERQLMKGIFYVRIEKTVLVLPQWLNDYQ